MDTNISSASMIAEGLQQLVLNSLEIMACYDSCRRYCAVSVAMTEMLRYPAEGLVGQTNRDLANFVHPEQLSTHGRKYWWQIIDDAIATVLQHGKAERHIHGLPTPDGVEFYETTYTPLVDNCGQVCQVLSISRRASAQSVEPSEESDRFAVSQLAAPPDALVGVEMPNLEEASLSDLPTSLQTNAAPAPSIGANTTYMGPQVKGNVNPVHQTAEFMQLVLDNIPQYIFWKDRNSKYLGCNRRWAEMAGIGDPKNAAGLVEEDLPWTPEQKEWYLQCDRRVMETDTPMLRIKQSQRQANGHLSWRETSKLPLHDTEGNVIGLLGTIEDITERKVAEDLLKQSEATFRQLAQQKELLNRISAQIRQSLRLEYIQQTTVNEVRQLLNVDRMLIYRFEENWYGRVVVEAVGKPWQSVLGEMGTDNCFPKKHAGLYREGRVRAINDVETAELDACHRDYLRNLGVQANLIVPILVKDGLWGLLIAHQCSGLRKWEENEVELLKALGGQVGVAIQQAELYAKAKLSAT
ncbi:MAG: GAF domain-containing protein, partial [Cyanobacteria bacterium J06639_14]